MKEIVSRPKNVVALDRQRRQRAEDQGDRGRRRCDERVRTPAGRAGFAIASSNQWSVKPVGAPGRGAARLNA